MISFLTIIEQTLLHLPLMAGAYISILMLQVPDLSIESAYVFGALIGCKTLMVTAALPAAAQLLIALSASMIGGIGVALTNSLIIRTTKMGHLLSAIITIGLFHGLSQLISTSYVSLRGLANPLTVIGSSLLAQLMVIAFITLIIIGALGVLMRTQIGYCLRIYGLNRTFFQTMNISAARVMTIGLCLAHALAGLAGYLFAQSNSFVELSMGFGKALLCITALLVGCLVSPGRNNRMTTVLLGCIAYFTVQQLLLQVGLPMKYFTALQAGTLAVLMSIARRYRANIPLGSLSS